MMILRQRNLQLKKAALHSKCWIISPEASSFNHECRRVENTRGRFNAVAGFIRNKEFKETLQPVYISDLADYTKLRA